MYSAALAAPEGVLENFFKREKFFSLWPRRDAYIWRLPGKSHWEKVSRRLKDNQIACVVADGGRGLLRGCYWADVTRFAVLDIDQGSPYHDQEELLKLRCKLADFGISGTCLYRSSESGGWHLYISFEGWVNSKELETSLKTWLRALGYSLQGGELEVFPTDNALRLPLLPDFAWLNDKGQVQVKREELCADTAIDRFMNDIESKANDWEYRKSRIECELLELADVRRQEAEKKDQGCEKRLDVSDFNNLYAAGLIQEHWDKGRNYWRDGLTEMGQRHDAVICIGHYLWYGDLDAGIAPLPGARHDEYCLITRWQARQVLEYRQNWFLG